MAGTDSFLGVRNFSGALDGGHGFIFGCQKFFGVFVVAVRLISTTYPEIRKGGRKKPSRQL